MSDTGDRRSDLEREFSQVIAVPSQLSSPRGPSPATITALVTPPEKPGRRKRLAAWFRSIREDRGIKRDRRRIKRAAARFDRKRTRKDTRVERHRPQHRRRDLPRILRIPRMIALLVLAGVLTLTLVTSIAESWRDLYEWGIHHSLSPLWANGVPLMVDTFIVGGEAALLVMAIDGRKSWHVTTRAWAVFVFGLSLSLVGNIGHLIHASISTRGTSALPPLAAAISLSIVLAVIKLIAADYDTEPAAEPVVQPEPEPAPAPSDTRTLVPQMAHVGQTGPVAQPVAQTVAHRGAPEPTGPKEDQRPRNGASRATAGRRPAVVADDAMRHRARQYLAQLRRDGLPFPSDRSLAKTHFNHPDGEGAGNRRAAQAALAEFTQPEGATA
jgi:hypothetical protein